MAKTSKGDIWFGVLDTSQSSTIVIRDDSLPEASSGRMYLYNTDRGQIVEYVESIVSAKLRDLNEEEQAALSPTLEKEFQAERKAFLREAGSRGNVYKLKTDDDVKTPGAKPKVDEVVPLEISDTDIDADDWIDEDDED